MVGQWCRCVLNMNYSKTTRGFTIVELLIVIVAIGILAALVLSSFAQAQAKARDTKRIDDIVAVQKAIEAHYATDGSYPIPNGIGGDGCLSSPWWDCWGAGSSANRLVNAEYLRDMPQDPTFVDDNACGFPNNGLTRAYYYGVNASRQGYILGTRLEAPNTSSSRYVASENNGCGSFMNYIIKKNWP